MVRLFHVARAYGATEVLSDVTLSIGAETALISGSAGAGKSVLARLLCGLEAPTRGWITVDGVPLAPDASDVLAAHRRRLAVIPQHSQLVSRASAVQNVALALAIQGESAGRAQERAIAALARVGCRAVADRLVETLSVGTRRLVCLARALVREDAGLILADEPGAGLDAAGEDRLGQLLAQEAARGATVIVLSQQPGVAGLDVDRVVFLEQGRVAWDSRREDAAAVS